MRKKLLDTWQNAATNWQIFTKSYKKMIFSTSKESAECLKQSLQRFVWLNEFYNDVVKFTLIPKCHFAIHLAEFAQYQNPRTFWTYKQESFIGYISTLGHSCSHGTRAFLEVFSRFFFGFLPKVAKTWRKPKKTKQFNPMCPLGLVVLFFFGFLEVFWVFAQSSKNLEKTKKNQRNQKVQPYVPIGSGSFVFLVFARFFGFGRKIKQMFLFVSFGKRIKQMF